MNCWRIITFCLIIFIKYKEGIVQQEKSKNKKLPFLSANGEEYYFVGDFGQKVIA